jgi:hypothetical protein
MGAYRKELDQKIELLEYLIDRYDDGRRKGFFCLAVNLFELATLRDIIKTVELDDQRLEGDRKVVAKMMVAAMERQAALLHIDLRLR